jgi:DTW domain-containing protein
VSIGQIIDESVWREVCWQCRRAKRVCLCHVIAPFKPAADVVFLQHPKKARNPVTLEGSKIFEGIDFTEDALVQAHLRSVLSRSVVIYPTSDARPAEELHDREEPPVVWLIDGTWAQARKMWRLNPWLQALPAYGITPKAPGNYRIRKEPAAHCLATIEATASILDQIGGKEGAHDRLLEPFTKMVDRQLEFVGVGGGRKRIRKTPSIKRVKYPAGLTLENTVLVHAEGNGWPMRSAEHRLLELRLIRPSTRKHAAFIVRSKVDAHPLAISGLALDQSRLPVIDEADVASHIQAFAGDATLVGWGQYAPVLLQHCIPLERFLDLKPLLVDYKKTRLGHVEEAVIRMNLPAPADAASRGERRMNALSTVFNAYPPG